MDEISVAEAAGIIGVSPMMVRKYVVAGKLAARMVSDVWLIDRQEAERFKRPNRGRPPKADKPKRKRGAK